MRDIAKPKITEMDVREFTKRQNMRDKYVREGGKKKRERERNRKVLGFYLFLSWLASHIKQWDMTTR